MLTCPSCRIGQLSRRQWLLHGYVECGTCHKAAEQSPRVRKIGWRAINLVAIVLVLVTIGSGAVGRTLFVAIVVTCVVAWQLSLYFSRPVPVAGEFSIGPSRAERVLAPMLWVLLTSLLIYAAYWSVVAP